jgi:hypothetical protein
MSHTSTKRWIPAQHEIGTLASNMVKSLNEGEESYQRFIEVYQYAGGTDQGMADLLFQDENGKPDPIAGTATAEQVAIIADARETMQGIHDLYVAANGNDITPSNIFDALRRMI